MKKIIVDSTPLIGLTRIGQIELLEKLAPKIIIPQAVEEETKITLSNGVILRPHAQELPMNIKIGKGEKEAILLAIEESGTLITDDLKARKIALEIGIPLTGTLGILLQAKQKNAISSIKPLLENLQSANFYLTERLIQKVLQKAGEGE